MLMGEVSLGTFDVQVLSSKMGAHHDSLSLAQNAHCTIFLEIRTILRMNDQGRDDYFVDQIVYPTLRVWVTRAHIEIAYPRARSTTKSTYLPHLRPSNVNSYPAAWKLPACARNKG